MPEPISRQSNQTDDKSLYFKLIEHIPGSMWAIDLNYQFIMGNKKFLEDIKEAFGINPQPGYDILSSITEEEKQEWKSYYDRAFRGEHFQLERKRRYATTVRQHKYFFSPVKDERGQIWAVSILAQDTTDQARATQELENTTDTLKVLMDSIDAHIYVSDLKTFEVLYVNEKIAQAFGNDVLGKKCYQVFRGNSGPCADCPIESLMGADCNPTDPYSWESKNAITGRWYLNTDRVIPWIDNQLVHIQIAVDINDRKGSEQKLQESESRYRNLLEFSPDGIITAEITGKVLSVNKAFLELTGFPESAFVGKNYTQIPTLLKRDMGFYRRIVESVISGKRLESIDYKWKHASGEIRDGDAKFSLTKFGKKSVLQVIVRDVTDQKAILQALSESEARYRGLVESSPDGILTLEPTGKVLSVNKSFLNLTGFPEEAFLNVHFSKIPTLLKSDWRFYKDAFKSVLAGGIREPVQFRWKNAAGEIRDGEARISPLRIGGKLILQSIVSDITSRKEQLKTIEKSDFIINSTKDAVVVTDTDGLITFWNNGAQNLLGYTAKDVIGKSIQIIYQHKNIQYMEKLIHGLINGVDFPDQEMALVDKSGKGITGLISLTTLKDEDGNVNELVWGARDISIQKETEQSLRLEQKRAQQYLDVADIMLLALDINQNIIAINPKGCEILGYSEDYLIGKNWFDNFLVSAEIEKVKTLFNQVLDGSADIADYFENMIRRSDGENRLIAWRNSILKDDQGKLIGVFSSGEDITERREAEIALMDSKETAERYLNIAAKIILSLDREGNITLLNPSGHQLLGYEPGELIGRNWFTTCIRKDQINKTREIFEKIIRGEDLEYASRAGDVVSKTGQVKHIAWHNSLLCDNQGKIIGVLSSGDDISERKRIMADLSHSRELIFRLSEAARQVQDMQDEETIFQAIGEEISKLGYHSVILVVENEGSELRQKHLSYNRQILDQAAKLTSNFSKELRINLEPGSYYSDILKGRETVLKAIDHETLRQALPGTTQSIRNQVIKTFGLQQAIFAPLTDENEPLGLLVVIGKDLTDEDVPPIALFASQASTALRNTRNAEALRQRTEDLESLTVLISETEEAERKRLSQELHDQVGQSLALLGFNLNQIKAQIAEVPDAKISKIEQAQQILNDVSNGIRSVMDDLRPAILDDYGFVSALHWYTDKFRERTGIEIVLEGNGLTPRLSKDKEITLFRITQEALTNITRHAKASKINITVSPSDSDVTFKIKDNGVGFDLKEVQSHQKDRGWGLINIQERVSRMGGSLDIITQPGQGTQLAITMPRE